VSNDIIYDVTFMKIRPVFPETWATLWKTLPLS